MEENLNWMNETVPSYGWIYKFICFCFGKFHKKLSYKELFLLFYGINRNAMGEENAKKKALIQILKIYKKNNNNKLPINI